MTTNMIEKLQLPATFFKGEQILFIEEVNEKTYKLIKHDGSYYTVFGNMEIYTLKKTGGTVNSVFLEFDGDMVGFSTLLEFDDTVENNIPENYDEDPIFNCFFG